MQALEECSPSCIHRDLKPSNVLVDASGRGCVARVRVRAKVRARVRVRLNTLTHCNLSERTSTRVCTSALADPTPSTLYPHPTPRRVADFSLARLLPNPREPLTGETGTYLYMAPEVISHQRYSAKADVFRWVRKSAPRPSRAPVCLSSPSSSRPVSHSAFSTPPVFVSWRTKKTWRGTH